MSDCYLRGSRLVFSDDEFIAGGGQGDVYGRGAIAYKIYHDPSGMIPVEKIHELRVLDTPSILGPRDVLYNNKGGAIGFTMPLVSGAIALCRLFANSFRRKKGITPKMSAKLVEAMISITQFVHDKKCLVADGNENNYLVDGTDLTKPFFIDVDNYCTPSFTAEFLNPSVRDYQSNGFSTLTDWYALAIVACQIFVGLHPFKGGHPRFDSSDLEGRMRKNVSIFNKEVSVPPPTRDYSNIPADYYSWFIDLFERGKRTPPPKVAGLLSVAQVPVQILKTTLKFVTSLLKSYSSGLVLVEHRDDQLIVITEKKELWIDKLKWDLPTLDCDVILFDGDPVVATVEKGLLMLRATRKEIFGSPMAADQTMVVENTLYVKQGSKLVEIGLTRFGGKLVVTPAFVWRIMPLSSTMYDSVLLQNALGKTLAVIPKPSRCYIIALPEMDGVRVVSGKCVGNVCMFSGYKKNRLTCLQFFFNDGFDKYICTESRTDDLDVNFTVLPNKVVAHWDGKRMHITYPNMTVDVIEDKGLPGNMALLHQANKLLFFVDNSVYHITLKR